MKRWARLNDRQHALLQRIAHAADPVTSHAPRLALTVYALRSRGLVTTPRHAGGWVAQVTDTGRYYLAHGHHPDHPRHQPRPPPPAVRPTVGKGAKSRPQRPDPRRDPDTARRAQQLIDRLTRRRPLRIADPDPQTRAAWRRTIHAAKTGGLVPAGLHLTYRGRDHGDLVIRLRRGAHPSHTAQQQPHLPVPETVDASNPIVAALAADPAALRVCPDCRPRALRIIHALADGAAARGQTIEPADDPTGSFVVVVDGHRYPVLVWETTERVPEEATPRDAWERRLEPERRFTHRLELSVPTVWPHRGRRARWGDRRRWRLEAKLAQVLTEIGQRAILDETARRAREQERLRRREQWKQAMRTARNRVVEARRLTALRGQLAAWQHARSIRIYATALDQHLRLVKDPVAAHSARVWLGWIRAYADRIDPSRQPPGMPPAQRIGPDDLRPFLDGWSPYGPDHHRDR